MFTELSAPKCKIAGKFIKNMKCPHCGKKLPKVIDAAKAGRLGGSAGRGASKARTSDQARAAALAMWAKRRKSAL